jgi:hypothetical protein
MYHFIVKKKLRRAFDHVNAGRYDRIIMQFAPHHRHAMYGEHALSGERRHLESTARWYDRLKALLPDLKFEIISVTVEGWPWCTRAIVEWKDSFTLPDGERGSNQGVHSFRLAWGRVTSLEVHCDTGKLAAYCDRLAALGRIEAAAPPICDPPS